MKLVNFYRKPISMFVMVTFTILLCFWANQAPAAPSAPAAEKNSEATIEQGDSGSPNFIEEESKSAATVKKPKKFPWLLAGAGIVAVGVLAYFLLIKKKSTSPYSNGVLTINGVRYELASIPAGTFQMGSNSSEAYPNEKPVHTVQISKGFWMGKTEVTQGLWQAVMGSNPSYFKKGDTYPIENVSWDDCQAFITKLNQMVGGNPFRLPTEAEWEYACRAGTTGDRYGNIDAIAWYEGNSVGQTHLVGQKQLNSWGLYDMLGNVFEWCQDYFGTYTAGYQTDPSGPVSGSFRVNRGGCWDFGARYVRSAIRRGNGPGIRDIILGFRLASGSAGG